MMVKACRPSGSVPFKGYQDIPHLAHHLPQRIGSQLIGNVVLGNLWESNLVEGTLPLKFYQLVHNEWVAEDDHLQPATALTSHETTQVPN
jgi:hypothetical protein